MGVILGQDMEVSWNFFGMNPSWMLWKYVWLENFDIP